MKNVKVSIWFSIVKGIVHSHILNESIYHIKLVRAIYSKNSPGINDYRTLDLGLRKDIDYNMLYSVYVCI